MYNNNDDICLIEDDHDDIATENPPDPNKWQSFELGLEELDCAAGVCWHPATAKKTASPRKPTAEQSLHAIRQEVASWFRKPNQITIEAKSDFALACTIHIFHRSTPWILKVLMPCARQ